MKTTLQTGFLWFAIAALAGLAPAAEACGGPEHPHVEAPQINLNLIAELRAAGPAGVETLLADEPPLGSPARATWEFTLDMVCAQHDCAASGLYWHRDFDQALEEAARTGRPILSLRLLGRLDDEYSCANSRFFRTALYPDRRIARRLRERFVLHWESVRPAPRLIIDFGDGRRLMGTITGNSIHYVLDARGRLVDALPGLYGPGMFLGAITRAEAAARAMAGLGDPEYLAALGSYHTERLAALDRALAAEGGLAAVPPLDGGPFGARAAAERTASKMLVELPVLNAIDRRSWNSGSDEPADAGFDWEALSLRHLKATALGAESRALLLRKHQPAAEDAESVIAGFERLVGLDTVRNEYLLHAELHRWMARWAEIGVAPALATFNRVVYETLFLTPESDPWLGLVAPETYLALSPSG